MSRHTSHGDEVERHDDMRDVMIERQLCICSLQMIEQRNRSFQRRETPARRVDIQAMVTKLKTTRKRPSSHAEHFLEPFFTFFWYRVAEDEDFIYLLSHSPVHTDDLHQCVMVFDGSTLHIYRTKLCLGYGYSKPSQFHISQKSTLDIDVDDLHQLRMLMIPHRQGFQNQS